MTEGSVAVRQARSDFWWLHHALTWLLSGLAIVALARHAFTMGSLSAPLELVMAAYAATMQFLFGWAEPYLKAALTWLGSFVGWRPTLYPHWRDVFVVLALLVAGFGRALWHEEGFFGAAFIASLLATVAIVAASLAGMLPLQSDSLTIQLLIAASCGLVLLVIVAFIMVVVAFISGLEDTLGIWSIPLIFIAVPTGATWLLSLVFDNSAGLGLVGLAASMILIGFALLVTGSPVPGRAVLGGYVGAAVFFAIDAGLKLLLG